MSNNFLDYNQPLQVIESNVPGARNTKHQGGILFFHLWMSQNQNGLLFFDTLFKKFINQEKQIGRIIEIGTAHGGLSVLFGLFSKAYGCDFCTYDIFNSPNYKNLFSTLQIDFRIKDVFSDEDVLKKEIQKDNISIIFCDGGNKVREFNTFSKYLKKGDVIIAHDYSPDREYYTKFSHNNIWSFHEIQLTDIQSSIDEYELTPILEKESTLAAMCCFQKK